MIKRIDMRFEEKNWTKSRSGPHPKEKATGGSKTPTSQHASDSSRKEE
jgi:hypothetical protein